MKLKTASYKRLHDHEERSIAHMAGRARADTIWGGAKAMMFERRLSAMGSRIDYGSIISDVYCASTGNWHPQHEAWECPECGQAYLGQEKAYACCQQQLEDEPEEPVIATWGDLKKRDERTLRR